MAEASDALSEERSSMAVTEVHNTIYKLAAVIASISLETAWLKLFNSKQGESKAKGCRSWNHLPRSWDDFHICASQVLSRCPDEAAAIWESLRQESRKFQFQGNLHDLCSSRSQPAGNGRALNMDETNKETLRGLAWLPRPSLWDVLTLVALFALAPFV
uniref:Uncharacterized protein n=1 Tax=Sphaerodactylus townsendi TaxID=933632 RepID=A0ACB8EA15_9SAUR